MHNRVGEKQLMMPGRKQAISWLYLLNCTVVHCPNLIHFWIAAFKTKQTTFIIQLFGREMSFVWSEAKTGDFWNSTVCSLRFSFAFSNSLNASNKKETLREKKR